MRSLSTIARRYLRRRPGRYVLTAVGVALGVAVLFAVLLVSQTTTRALDELVNGFTGDSDLVVSATGAYDVDLPDTLVSQAAALPDVEAAVGMLGIRTEVRGVPPGTVLEDFAGPTVDEVFVYGIDLDEARKLRRFELQDGRFAAPGTPELVLAAHLAERIEADVGETVVVASTTGRIPLTVVGILEDTGAALANAGNTGYLPLDSARTMQGKGAVFTEVDIALKPGVDIHTWLDDHRRALGEQYLIQDATELAAAFREFITSVAGALTLVAGVALFVGAFLIFLTFTVSVAERTRVYGTLRALGASPKQVRRLVVAEALTLGAVASIVGLVIGYGLALLSIGLVESLLELDAPSLGLPLGLAVVSVGLGLVTTVVSSLIPARRAAAVGPVDAMRGELSRAEPSPRPIIATGVIVASVVVGRVVASPAVRGLASMGVLLGAVFLVPSVLRPLAAALGGVTSRLARGVGEIAVLHLRKERSRSVYTLALVMVVLASILAMGATNQAMARSIDDVIDKQFGSDIQLFAPGAIDQSIADELRAVEGVGTVTALRFGRTEIVRGDDTSIIALLAIDTATYFEVQGFAWRDGDDASAAAKLGAGGAVLLPTTIADDLDLDVGDRATLRSAAGEHEFLVAGIHSGVREPIAVIGMGDGDALFGGGNPNAFALNVEPGFEVAQVQTAIYVALAGDHAFELRTLEDSKQFAHDQLAGFFGIAYAILLVTTIIGMLGLANTLIVSVLHRTREIGILRSAGSRRRQVRGMVLVEAATLVLVAYVLALPLGQIIGQVAVKGFGQSIGIDVAFRFPWLLVPLVAVIAGVVGVLASVGPARRAARLDVVTALRFD